jgi:hypothetical protein
MRMPLVIMAVLAAGLLGLDALLARGEEPAGEPPAPVATIAKRVEGLRGLRFETVPRAVAVAPEQAREEGLADYDRTYPEARRHADETVLDVLGLVPRGTSLREVAASLFEGGVAGYYDPRTKRLRTVSGPSTGTRVLAESVLAHELTHALEDQRFDLLGEVDGGSDDAQLARLALVEGSATALMDRYMDRYFSAGEVLAGVIGSAFVDTGDMPPFLQTQVTWPYLGGQAFVAELLRRAGGRWDLVDVAERTRPPASSEQVLHPERYLRADQPRRVALDAAGVLGAGWTRAGAGTWGELRTRELLASSGGGGAGKAAEGWGGDRWELWRTPAAGSVLVMRWVWDTRRDAREFASRLGQWTREGDARAPAFVVVGRDGAVTLALAPSAALARRISSGA